MLQGVLVKDGHTMRNVTQSTRVVGKGLLGLAGLRNRCYIVAGALFVGLTMVICSGTMHGIEAQAADPTMLDPNLAVRTVVDGLNQPTSMAFLGLNDILVLEKPTGKVQRVVNGVIQQSPVLDLAVNFASERGLLGIALHPDFSHNGFVYLYWTCRRPAAGEDCDEGPDSGVL